jgi:hypothetical protein
MTGDDQKIVFRGAVAAYFAEGDVEAFGANPRCFRQNRDQIPLAKREAAEPGDRGLLAKQLLNLGSGIGHGTARLLCSELPANNMDCPAAVLYP